VKIGQVVLADRFSHFSMTFPVRSGVVVGAMGGIHIQSGGVRGATIWESNMAIFHKNGGL